MTEAGCPVSPYCCPYTTVASSCTYITSYCGNWLYLLSRLIAPFWCSFLDLCGTFWVLAKRSFRSTCPIIVVRTMDRIHLNIALILHAVLAGFMFPGTFACRAVSPLNCQYVSTGTGCICLWFNDHKKQNSYLIIIAITFMLFQNKYRI